MENYKPDPRQVYSDIVDDLRENGLSWNDVRLGGADSPDGTMYVVNTWAKLKGLSSSEYYSQDEWEKLVNEREQHEKDERDFITDANSALIGKDTINNFFLSSNNQSQWQTYLRTLKRNGFSDESIKNIKSSTEDILKHLNPCTDKDSPLRGLVVGNVQSGKTANMTGLICAAADNGFNMFIILSGMIDNLRIQTENRFKKDLESGNPILNWKIITNPGPKSTDTLSQCNFGVKSKYRYMSIVLKNSTRLKNLISWLKSDPQKLEQMKILIIDDEADQASINTKDVTTDEEGKINGLIRDLVFSRYWAPGQTAAYPQAVDYLGYTATPYANVLNEAGKDSLFPSDLIYSLPVSPEYFGPEQIIGLRAGYSADESLDKDLDGLNIIREIPESQIKQVEEDQNGLAFVLPETLKDSICWFLCSVAALRFQKIRRPFSMLVHTSQKTSCHEILSNLIQEWLQSAAKTRLLARCESVWTRETKNLTLQDFLSVMKNYPTDNLKNYPSFDDIKPDLLQLIQENVQHISLDDDQNRHYGNGIHLCVDNSTNNRPTDDNEMLRLLYPTAANMPEKAPAFLVVGGMTLSRGLTLEGLISTYFLRTTKLGDTLMQMGRWFGYRRNYELYPRIWMSQAAIQRFEELTMIDYDLRREIQRMARFNQRPGDKGVKVQQTSGSHLGLTAKNKMQSAQTASSNFSGLDAQTQLFDADTVKQKQNLQLTDSFLQKLGTPSSDTTRFAGSGKVWTNVPNRAVCGFLEKFNFQKNMAIADKIKSLIPWLDEATASGKLQNWSVVLASKGSHAPQWGQSPYRIGLVNRSRITDNEHPAIINTGAVKSPNDALADILETPEFEKLRKQYPGSRPSYLAEIRRLSGMEEVPLLILYIIDKNSVPQNRGKGMTNRAPLNSSEDLVGLSIRIPGVKNNSSYTDYVSVNLNNDEADISEEN